MCACRLLFFERRNIRQIIQILIKNDFIYGGKQSHGGRVRDCSEIPPPYVFYVVLTFKNMQMFYMLKNHSK